MNKSKRILMLVNRNPGNTASALALMCHWEAHSASRALHRHIYAGNLIRFEGIGMTSNQKKAWRYWPRISPLSL